MPAGGLAWQEVHEPAVSGEAAWWQTVHRGASTRGEVPVTAWQLAQLVVNAAWVTVVWAGARNGTGCEAPPFQEKLVCTWLWQVTVQVCPVTV